LASGFAVDRRPFFPTLFAASGPVAASLLAWIIIFWAVRPSQQDFPLGDDWAFSHSFQDVADGKGINYRQFAFMPQLGQWLWALPFYFCSPGLTHTTLRISTIALSCLGLLAVFDLFRQEGMPPGIAGFLTAVLALNPLFFELAGTFMTDVPAFSFAFISLACFVRALGTGRMLWLFPAVAAALLAVTTRQNTLTVLLVAGILLWKNRALRFHPIWLTAVVLPIVVAVLVHLWFINRDDALQPGFAPQPPEIALAFPFLILHTCGLMCLPAALLCWRPRSAGLLLLSVGLMGVAALYWAGNHLFLPSFDKHYCYPYMIPILGPWGPFCSHFQVGLGPLLLRVPLRIGLSVAGCIGGGYLLTRIIEYIQAGPAVGPTLWFSVLQVPLLFLAPSLYDRYFIFLLPGALFLLAGPSRLVARPGRLGWVLGTLLLATTACFSVSLMHDWLSWNSKRWTLGSRALDARIDPHDIEGGFEWDGWWAPPQDSRSESEPARRRPGLTLEYTERSKLGAVTGRYAIGFQRIDIGLMHKELAVFAAPIDREDCSIWTNPGVQTIYLYKLELPRPEPSSGGLGLR
jgi:hypothetical protein